MKAVERTNLNPSLESASRPPLKKASSTTRCFAVFVPTMTHAPSIISPNFWQERTAGVLSYFIGHSLGHIALLVQGVAHKSI